MNMDWSEIKHDQFGNAYVTIQEATRKVNSLAEQLQSQAGQDFVGLAGVGVVAAVIMCVLLFSAFFTVQQQTAEIIERFGRFHRIALPGLRFRIPLIEQRVWEADLRIQSLDLTVETKTKDNVFVYVRAAVQYAVMPDKIYESYYQLADDEEQLKSYVFDVIRGRVPKLELDQTFEQKDDIAQAVKAELIEAMASFGYMIHQVLVTDIEPDKQVKLAMNQINAAQRERSAATERGEAEKIIAVKKAEAEKESAVLQGQGVAGQRKAIIDGLKGSVEEFQQAVPGATPEQVMQVVMMTQYFDMLKDLSANGESRVILVPHSPAGVNDVAAQVRQALLTVQESGR